MHRLAGWLALGVAFAMTGCGGGAKPVEQSATDAKPPENQAVQAPAPLVPPALNVPVPPSAPSAVAKKTGPAELPPPEDGAQWYEMADGEEPGYELVRPQPGDVPANLFSVTAPPAGTNASTFDVAAAAPAGSATSGAGAGASSTGASGAGSAAGAKFTLPDGFKAVAGSGTAEDGAPLRITCDKDGATMAYIPAGTVKMGLKNGPPEASPELAVPLDAFYIDIAEVTVWQFEAYRTDVKDSKKLVKPEPLNPKDPPDYPARGVPWGEARFYAQWASKALPSEAQWEMAARGTKGFNHPWGNDRPLWPKRRDPAEITAVKSFRADQSVFGVFDMAGNVREWTGDFYSATAFKDNSQSPSGSLKNWEGPKRGSVENARVLKGNGPNWEVWQRAPGNMRDKLADVGFRCVVALKAKK